MSQVTNADKLAQFEEFFAIAHEFNVNVTELKTPYSSFDSFVAAIPLPFQMASESVAIEQSSLRALHGLSSAALNHLVEFLNFQSQKIDMLVNYILSQQDDAATRFQGTKFGGGGIEFISEQAFNLGQMLQLKIFMLEDNCAVFCVGEVIEITQRNDQFNHKLIFHFIREEDREVLVRTSLHQQSKQLKALAKKRQEQQQ